MQQKFAAAVAAAVTALACPRAIAADAAMGAGPGAMSCAEFAQRYAKNPDIYEPFFFAWAQGFMTGLSLAHKAHGGDWTNVRVMTDEEQQRYLRAFCADNPLSPYGYGVADLFNEIKARQPQ